MVSRFVEYQELRLIVNGTGNLTTATQTLLPCQVSKQVLLETRIFPVLALRAATQVQSGRLLVAGSTSLTASAGRRGPAKTHSGKRR